MKLTAKTIALGLAAWAWLVPGANALAQNCVVIVGCTDAIALNAVVTLTIVRNLADHGLVEVHG